GTDGFPRINDCVYEFDNITPRNRLYVPSLPSWQNVVGECSPGIVYVALRPPLPFQVPLNEVLGYGLDVVVIALCGGLLLLSGVTTLTHAFVQVCGSLTSSVHREGAMKADRNTTLLPPFGTILKHVHPFAGRVDPHAKLRDPDIP